MTLAEIFTAEADWADVFFLVAVIAAVISAVGSFGTNQLSKHAGWLLAVAVASAAFGLLLL
jgi:hypothetical protein